MFRVSFASVALLHSAMSVFTEAVNPSAAFLQENIAKHLCVQCEYVRLHSGYV